MAGIYLPEGQESVDHVTVCDEADTAAMFDETKTIIGAWPHAHEYGEAITSRLYRDGAEVAIVGQADPFNFDQQTIDMLPERIEMQPGDRIETTCNYNTMDAPGPVSGGESTGDEMCINFLLYYPNDADVEGCGTI